MIITSSTNIRTRSIERCPFCGHSGDYLYENLQDRLFGAPGFWNMRLCRNADCSIAWLDPVPVPEDIGEIYKTYYTHGLEPEHRARGPFLTETARWGIKLVYGIFKRAFSIKGERLSLDRMCLPKRGAGRLLEVGCGSGHRLARFRETGRLVEGQEIDPKAAANAGQQGLNVHVGGLIALSLAEASYDEIVMNHVIEHLENPVEILAECWRLLKPGGTIAIITPNIQCYGHSRFNEFWRGLEPPRHMRVFSVAALRGAAMAAGFGECRAWTSAARAERIGRDSLSLRRTVLKEGDSDAMLDIKAMAFQVMASMRHMVEADSGEECVVLARK